MKALKIIAVVGIFFCMNSCITEGDSPSLEGNWTCQETSEIYQEAMKAIKGTTIFPIYIAQDISNSNKYYIDNFYQLGEEIQVTIQVLGRTITITNQKVSGFDFEGSGTISADYNTIDLTFTADDGGGQIDHVTSQYTR